MKRSMIMAGMALLLIIAMISHSDGAGYGHRREGLEGAVTYTHDVECDSIVAEYGYDGAGADASNYYAEVTLYPETGATDSTMLQGDALNLDSIGLHLVRFVIYEHATNDNVADAYEFGVHLHEEAIIGSGTAMPWQFYLCFVDTSATPDDTLSNINAHLQNQTGTRLTGVLTSNSEGRAGPYYVVDSVETVINTPDGYTFDANGSTVTANDTLYVHGYSTSTTNYATVYGYEYDVTGSPRADVIISVKRLTIIGVPGTDSVNNIIVGDVLAKDTSSALGYWSFPKLKRTGTYLPDTTIGFYRFEAYDGNRKVWAVDTVYVGDVGDLNMADYLGGWRYP